MGNDEQTLSNRGAVRDAPLERRVAVSLILVVVVTAVLVASLRPDLLRFWPFTPAEFVQLITPLFLIALFIERVVEVFLTTWRAAGARDLEITARQSGADAHPKRALTAYKSRTQRMAFLLATALGVVVSALGIRMLELFLDPAVFGTISTRQRSVFMMADVLFTGAVLGGGADGLHKVVLVFTNFMDSTGELAKRRTDRRSEA